MANNAFMDKLRTFFGIRPEPPRNDFRNPIWGSDDEDDGDELYSRNHTTAIIDPMDLHREMTKQMRDMFRSFGSMFGDMQSFFHDENFDFPGLGDLPSHYDSSSSGNIRDHYLKPGYDNHRGDQNGDVDLDGKISSNEISGLLKRKDAVQDPNSLFSGDSVPGRSFCQTIITTSIKKPDGTVETRRIVKNGNDVTEETVTTTNTATNVVNPAADSMTASFVYNGVLSEVLTSLFRNFY